MELPSQCHPMYKYSQSLDGQTDKRSSWLQWSHERRASFNRKISTIDAKAKQAEQQRVTTPVLKARKESVMFVNDNNQASDPEINYVTKLIRPSSTEGTIMDECITVSQWKNIIAFWDAPCFYRCRKLAVLCATVAILLSVVIIARNDWYQFKGHPCYGDVRIGLWSTCSQSKAGNCSSFFSNGYNLGLKHHNMNLTEYVKDKEKFCALERSNWPIAVVCILLSSAAFAVLGLTLAVVGYFYTNDDNALPTRIYYWHSASEIFVISGILTACGMILYPFCIQIDKFTSKEQSFGMNFIMAYVVCGCYILSALLLATDGICRILAERFMHLFNK